VRRAAITVPNSWSAARTDGVSDRGACDRRIVFGSVFDEEALEAATAFADRVLQLKRPFSILWDPRAISWPRLTTRLMRMGSEWAEKNALEWDTRVQAHALLVPNPVLASIASLLIRLFAPPQPVSILKDDDEARAFAQSCCARPRSWVKDSYDTRDEQASCSISWPSANAWAVAFGTHLGLLCLVGAPLGLLLYAVPRHTRRAAGATAAVVIASGVPLAVHLIRFSRPDGLPWMVPFLASTFGFSTAFKCLAAAMGTTPDGADINVPAWLLWFTSLPEPAFEGGRLQRCERSVVFRRVSVLMLKLLSLGALLSALLRSPSRLLCAEATGLVPRALNSLAHLWLIYLWASVCLDIGTLLLQLAGSACMLARLSPSIHDPPCPTTITIQTYTPHDPYMPHHHADVRAS
jgi:hypothetical protein